MLFSNEKHFLVMYLLFNGFKEYLFELLNFQVFNFKFLSFFY